MFHLFIKSLCCLVGINIRFIALMIEVKKHAILCVSCHNILALYIEHISGRIKEIFIYVQTYSIPFNI